MLASRDSNFQLHSIKLLLNVDSICKQNGSVQNCWKTTTQTNTNNNFRAFYAEPYKSSWSYAERYKR